MADERIVNLHEIALDESSDERPYVGAWAKLAERLGAKRLGFNVSAIQPGAFSCPYHWHLREEELFIALSGRALVRCADGVREVRAGDLVFFRTGPEGSHQFYNHGDEPFRYFALSNIAETDVCEYPDSGKILLRGAGRAMFRRADAVEYMDGERDPKAHWPEGTIKG
ncbi:MAG: cupin domain-containing protein [Planctomycetes bacterium]|nr:cupin domain-containing protein [Planctomycetota bacterium]